ncbi:MAG: bacterial transcriptional activator domain-containing protein [Bacteroidota bacterium]
MTFDDSHIDKLLESETNAELKVYTLGRFNFQLKGQEMSENWGRDKAIQLFQFFIISRNRMALHKEQIIDRLWEESGTDQHFKVALHEIKKVLEPNKKDKNQTQFIFRQGSSYKLNMEKVWLDSQALKSFVEIGNQLISDQSELAIFAYQSAVKLYKGIFLPNRIYEDWTSGERDNLQMLSLGAHISLAQLFLDDQPKESVRLTEEALNIDPTWEEAYRIQMQAHMISGNRPQAIRTFQKCKAVLEEEFGIDPLPQTIQLIEHIIGK